MDDQFLDADDSNDYIEFDAKKYQTECMNTAKTAKVSGNDISCSANIAKLIKECERL